MVHLSQGELNQFFDILEDWEAILQAEKALLNNDVTFEPSSSTSNEEGA